MRSGESAAASLLASVSTSTTGILD